MYFETIKCEDFEVFNLEYHQKRVIQTIAKDLNLQEYINPISDELLRCKLIYNQDEILSVEYFPYIKKDIKSFKIIFDDKINYSKKYLNRENLDRYLLKKGSCDEIIFVKNGIVSDTTIANIAIFYDDVWITSKDCLLEGTTRARLIKEGFLKVENISLQMLRNAKKLALMNAMIGFDEIKDYSFK